MSRRPFLVTAAAAVGLGVVTLTSLAVIGSTDTTTDAGGWSGWTGHLDTNSIADTAAMTPDDSVAVALLARSAAASSTVAYTGRAVSWDRAATVTTDLTHLPGRGTVALIVGAPASQAVFAAEGRSASFADDGRPLALLRDNFRVLREAGLDRLIAGRVTDAVVAVSADGAVAARYWIDRSTGLLLCKELLDAKGLIRQRTSFETLRIGVRSDVVVPDAVHDAWSVQLDAAGLVSARRAGCACPEGLPGGLQLLDSRQAPAGTVSTTPVVHQLFSDGLTTVSLFSMAGEITAEDAAGLTSRGFRPLSLNGYPVWVRGGAGSDSEATVVWVGHGAVLTLVTGDAADPLGTASAVVTAMPPTRDPSQDTLLSRIERGWQHLVGGQS